MPALTTKTMATITVRKVTSLKETENRDTCTFAYAKRND